LKIAFNPLSGKFDFAPSQFVFINRLVYAVIKVTAFRVLLQHDPIFAADAGYDIDADGEVLMV